MYGESFQENEVEHNAEIVLHEYKNLENQDADEGGEDEMEEPEDEQNEEAEDDNQEAQEGEDKPQDEQKDEEPKVTKVEDIEGTQKASEVLFDNEAKSENKQNE